MTSFLLFVVCVVVTVWLAREMLRARDWLRARMRWRREALAATRLPMLRATDLRAMSPVAFEHHCAAVLKAQGWMCKMTRASGDFGIDVIAEKSGARVAIQVKKWAAPVSLSAVQEAAAGMPMYRANIAAVVSVSGYQPSARTLARVNGVVLLAYDDLFDFRIPGRPGRP